MNEEIINEQGEQEPEAAAEEVTEYQLPAFEDLAEYVIDREATDLPSGWWAAAGPGLDPDEPVVQELAFHLLTTFGLTTPQAMMGGKGRKPNDDRPNKRSLGEDGRWFANPKDVLLAARAWAKSLGIKPADYPWVVRRPRSAA